MRDFSGRLRISSTSPQRKRLGGYLVEAGLLTPAQVDVALNDQKLTGMRFGEILAARGWVKQQTIEYLMQKVVLPEQQSGVPQDASKPQMTQTQGRSLSVDTVVISGTAAAKVVDAAKPSSRRDLPISKPLPSVGSADGDVSWVG